MSKKIIPKNNPQLTKNKCVQTNQNTTKFPYQPKEIMDKNDLSLYEFFKIFPDEESARKYFEKKRWNSQIICPHCSSNNIHECKNHSPMPYRCRTCRKFFSVRFGTILEESKLPLHKWLFCMYLMRVNRKGISSVQISKILGVTQKTSWFLCQRIREVWMKTSKDKLDGIIEIDETYIGGLEKNKKKSQRRGWGRGPSGKLIVVGGRSREGKVITSTVPDNKQETLHGFINDNIEKGSTVITDTWKSYNGLTDFTHHKINHSVKEFVRGIVHTNGIESFWAILKRGYYGIYHYMSEKHLNRYVHEFSFRYNTSKENVLDFLGKTIEMMEGKKLTYCDLKK